MKKNLKNIIPAIIIATTIATSSIYANELPQNNAQNNNISATNNKTSNSVVTKLQKQGDLLLFPVRETFEALGFEVSYEPNFKIVTLAKGPMYVTFSTNKDGYTFARMAPQKLGTAPIVKDGVTFVPTTLLTEIMQLEGVTIDGLTMTISDEMSSENVENTDNTDNTQTNTQNLKSNQIIISDINKDKSSITVEDPEKGEVVLNIKDLKIDFATDEKELMIGQAIEVVYGDIMTNSLPPINNPKSIKVVQKYNIVEVLSVEKDDKGYTRVLVKDAKLGEVILIVSNETKLDGVKEFSKGQILKVAFSNAMTMSLPPQTAAKEISIFNQSTEEFSKVEIISVNKENKTITIKDAKLGTVVLNVSSLEILDEDNKKVSDISILKEGQKLNVIFGAAMTRSLPPINNPVKVIVLK